MNADSWSFVVALGGFGAGLIVAGWYLRGRAAAERRYALLARAQVARVRDLCAERERYGYASVGLDAVLGALDLPEPPNLYDLW